MMTTTAVSPSTWKAPSHGHSSSRSSRPSTTPRTSYPTAASVGQSRPPILSPQARSVAANQGPSSASPSYFGFVVGDDSMPPDSGPGHHTKQNWNTTATTSRPSAKYMPNERNPEFELFRRQSEKSLPFALSGLPTPRSSSNNSPVNIAPADSARAEQQKLSSISLQDDRKPRRNSKPSTSQKNTGDVSFFSNIEQTQSPGSLTPEQSISDSRDARLSLPASELEAQLSQMGNPKVQRSETVSSNLCKENPCMAAPQEVVQAIQSFPQDVLVLDLRVYPQYAASRVRGALNLCIPTTLLKRPAFNVQKLAETFTGEAEKKKFMIWSKAKYIIVYDATSSQAKEAVTSFNVLKKFSAEGWKGQGLVVKGGFHAIKRLVPRMIDSSQSAGGGNNMSTSPLAISPPNQNNLPVAGGCAMPATKNAANPFFGNIRQNMDLLDGVGQLPIHKPEKMSKSEEQHLPRWLKRAASISNDGKEVSDKFLGIERTEQKRMQKALSGNVSYGTPITESKSKADVQVAGIEKGSKNRYNNIFPFEHSRVRLQNVPSYGCDYVNASFVKAEFSNRKYIATQAPIPQTFEDFWKVVWEQDVKVVVMLTAESEGGQIKSHPYWQSSEYGPIRVKLLREEQVSLTTGHVNSAASQPKASHNRSQTTANATPFFEKMPKDAAKPAQDAAPSVTVRHLSILHTAYPFQTMRDVIQIQYTEWPDFGAPASPTSILSLIEMVNKYQLAATSVTEEKKAREPVPEGERPIVVHCSAGCGRTGTFCTIDSVIDMIKRQRLEALDEDDDDTMDVDSENDWVNHDEIDLVAKAVEDFRSQRLSMVQNLRQFVLCYESILQWLHDDTTGSRDGMRRSYHG